MGNIIILFLKILNNTYKLHFFYEIEYPVTNMHFIYIRNVN